MAKRPSYGEAVLKLKALLIKRRYGLHMKGSTLPVHKCPECGRMLVIRAEKRTKKYIYKTWVCAGAFLPPLNDCDFGAERRFDRT
jgi:predicted RNA-binding Zn-ribbon protein involved in translation (DUF1610 family)